MGVEGSVTFRATREAYDKHIGRYGTELGRRLLAFAGIATEQRILDVGCGTGLLTAQMAATVGAANVAAVDPSEPFATATRARVAGVNVCAGRAERLPFLDASFDAVLSQLVVNFLSDAVAGVAEMRRVTRPGGMVAACVWDYAEGMTLLRAFWDAARRIDPDSRRVDEAVTMHYCDPGELATLWRAAGLRDVESAAMTVSAQYADIEDAWRPFLAGVAPSGAYVATLDEAARTALREEFAARLGSPAGPFALTARAWAVGGLR